ncbi:FixC Dehydrogenases (flavoproteins) [Fimbriimonadaceae bacterium]
MLNYDVAIIGGGPAGSTLGTLIKKYAPDASVVILEREQFPREHVGESQLPLIGSILDEMGVWEKVEAANFPIKIGATYRWGKTADLWDFEFLPGKDFVGGDRPAKYEGERRKTAFQVERSIYDKILLDHARECGCEVRENTPVTQVLHEGGAVAGLQTTGGEVKAKYYVDGSGNAAILRRALGVTVDEPSRLKNVAFWSYWDDAEWAVTLGKGGTRVNVMSLGYGWLWFIPISATRVSVGLVLPADAYKAKKLRPEDLYLEAIQSEALISKLLRNATQHGPVHGTKDWSFVANQMAGPNWYLVGEAAGFADPILAAGLTLTHTGARELAYILVDHLKGTNDRDWLASHYQVTQQKRIRQHIRFADYWYTANAHFSELKEFVTEIAKDAGLELTPNEAFQWLGTGGFINDDWRVARVATFALGATKQLTQFFGEGDSTWEISKFSRFRANLAGAEVETVPAFHMGQILLKQSLRRGEEVLPLVGIYQKLADFLQLERTAQEVQTFLSITCPSPAAYTNGIEVFEAMLVAGWVTGRCGAGIPGFEIRTPDQSEVLHLNNDQVEPMMNS